MISRRSFLTKATGVASAFCFTNSYARREVAWPSENTIGSIQKQTKELTYFLENEFIVNCRPGIFVLENPIRVNAKYIDIRGSQGGEKTELHCLNERKGGLNVHGAIGINISDIHLYWPPVGRKARHHSGAGILLVKSMNILVLRSSVHGAPGAGIHFERCRNVNARSLFVENTLADGVHFQNSSNCNGYDLTTSNTGDDGVAIVDYRHSKKSSGFYLEKITTIGSEARGIAFVGARNGVLKDFFIDLTHTNGLHIEQDAHYDTRASENIRIISGEIKRSGDYKSLYKAEGANAFGVNILRAKNIHLDGINVSNTRRFGCFISSSQQIKLFNMFVKNSRQTAMYFLNTNNILLKSIEVQGVASPFFNVSGVVDLQGEKVVIIDQSHRLEVSAIFVHRTKLSITKNIYIHALELKSIENNVNKVFLIKASQVENVKFEYSSIDTVKVFGGAGEVALFRKY